MFCRKCGETLEERDCYCWKCGAATRGDAPARRPAYEACTVEVYTTRPYSEPQGAWLRGLGGGQQWAEAVQVGLDGGTIVIGKSRVAEFPFEGNYGLHCLIWGPSYDLYEEWNLDLDRARRDLEMELISQGWEVQTTNEKGQALTLRRPKST
ncbi:MAG TPA: hypothetical protein PLN42_11920 [Anaerolineae bacterium]|nr:hypothetical protein [Anaerolineae bacterium]